MFEFGNQFMRCDGFPWKMVAKKYFTELGIEHVSLDLNGLDGALKRDITNSVSDLGVFDIVTNFGCSEHVDKAGQYTAFKHLYELCCIGGILVHYVPLVDNWKGHCDITYDEDFFKRLPGKHIHLMKTPIGSYKAGRNSVECVTVKTDNWVLNRKDF
jgi:hypothetical protein